MLQLMLLRPEAYLVDLCIALQLWRRAGEASIAGGLMQQILLPCGPEARGDFCLGWLQVRHWAASDDVWCRHDRGCPGVPAFPQPCILQMMFGADTTVAVQVCLPLLNPALSMGAVSCQRLTQWQPQPQARALGFKNNTRGGTPSLDALFPRAVSCTVLMSPSAATA